MTQTDDKFPKMGARRRAWAEMQVGRFNLLCVPGSTVRYYPPDGDGKYIETRTCSSAVITEKGEAVVALDRVIIKIDEGTYSNMVPLGRILIDVGRGLLVDVTTELDLEMGFPDVPRRLGGGPAA